MRAVFCTLELEEVVEEGLKTSLKAAGKHFVLQTLPVDTMFKFWAKHLRTTTTLSCTKMMPPVPEAALSSKAKRQREVKGVDKEKKEKKVPQSQEKQPAAGPAKQKWRGWVSVKHILPPSKEFIPEEGKRKRRVAKMFDI